MANISKSSDMKNYDTLQEALKDVRERGYTHDFTYKANGLFCTDMEKAFPPEQFEVVEVHRFEGMSSAGDNEVLYVIEGKDGTKGALVDAYGVYSEHLSPEMVEKMRVHYKV